MKIIENRLSAINHILSGFSERADNLQELFTTEGKAGQFYANVAIMETFAQTMANDLACIRSEMEMLTTEDEQRGGLSYEGWQSESVYHGITIHEAHSVFV